MAVYFDSEPIIVLGDEGIAKDAIERDIYLLIHSFAKVCESVDCLCYRSFLTTFTEKKPQPSRIRRDMEGIQLFPDPFRLRRPARSPTIHAGNQ
jgi:hypothetical protein